MSDFTFAQSNRLPSWEKQFLSDDDQPINLTSCTVQLFVRNATDGTVKVNLSAVVITSALEGKVRYDWSAGDATAMVAGIYEARFKITDASGKTLDVPNDTWLTIEVTDPIGAGSGSLSSDLIFGISYLSASEFIARKAAFPVTDNAVPTDKASLLAQLAAASRLVDQITGKSFVPDEDITEQHMWNAETRRIRVSQPPIASISSFQIFIGPATYANFLSSDLFVNNDIGYVEVASLAMASSILTPALSSLGIDPVVKIVYKSVAEVPPHVKLATGYIAAQAMEKAFVHSEMPSGIQEIVIGGNTKVRRFDSSGSKNNKDIFSDIPDVAMLLLQNEVEVAIA